jgi:hypothetical protein
MLPQLLNIIGGTKCADPRAAAARRATRAGPSRAPTDGADDQHAIDDKIEVLARQRAENQCRRQQVHVDSIDPGHVRIGAAGVEVAQQDDAEYRQDDAEDALDHDGVRLDFSSRESEWRRRSKENRRRFLAVTKCIATGCRP